MRNGILKEMLAQPVAKQPVLDVIGRELLSMQFRMKNGKGKNKVTSWDLKAEDLRHIMAECKADLAIHAKRKIKAKHFENSGKAKKPRFPPSGAGDCLRKLWFRHFDAPSDPVSLSETISGHFIREVGTQMHLLIQLLLRRAGVLVEREARIKTKNPTISGFCDGILNIDGVRYGFEFKTISDDRLRSAGGEPLEHHIQQVRLYQSDWFMPFSLLYMTRNSCKLQEHIIQPDRAAVDKALVRPRRSERFIKAKLLPDKEGSDLNKAPCRWCSYTAICNGGVKLKEFVDEVRKA